MGSSKENFLLVVVVVAAISFGILLSYLCNEADKMEQLIISEIKKGLLLNFDKLDKNHDGVLDESESSFAKEFGTPTKSKQVSHHTIGYRYGYDYNAGKGYGYGFNMGPVDKTVTIYSDYILRKEDLQ